jgi:pterin-4a-carbinolamine dehydratase
MQQIANNNAGTLAASFSTLKNLRKLSARDLEELKPERVQETLQAMPGWKLDVSRKAIDRFYEFSDSKVALAFAAYVTELAGSVRQPISVFVSGGRLGLTLHGQPRRGKKGGLTLAVMELAKRLG